MAKKRKRNPLKKHELMKRVDAMLPILHVGVINVIRIEAVLEVGNDIVGSLDNKKIPGAESYNTIKQCLSFDLAMHLARLFETVSRKKDPNRSTVASIPLLLRLIRQRRCQAELLKRARNGRPPHPDRLYGLEQDCLDAIQRASRVYADIFKGAHGRGGMKVVKEFRDTFLAHSDMEREDVNPRYNQLFRLVDCARDFVAEAHLAVKLENTAYDFQEEQYRRNALEFWERALMRGKPSDGMIQENVT